MVFFPLHHGPAGGKAGRDGTVTCFVGPYSTIAVPPNQLQTELHLDLRQVVHMSSGQGHILRNPFSLNKLWWDDTIGHNCFTACHTFALSKSVGRQSAPAGNSVAVPFRLSSYRGRSVKPRFRPAGRVPP